MSVGKEQSLKGLTFKFSEKPILFVFLVSRTRETNDIVLYIAAVCYNIASRGWSRALCLGKEIDRYWQCDCQVICGLTYAMGCSLKIR